MLLLDVQKADHATYFFVLFYQSLLFFLLCKRLFIPYYVFKWRMSSLLLTSRVISLKIKDDTLRSVILEAGRQGKRRMRMGVWETVLPRVSWHPGEQHLSGVLTLASTGLPQILYPCHKHQQPFPLRGQGIWVRSAGGEVETSSSNQQQRLVMVMLQPSLGHPGS